MKILKKETLDSILINEELTYVDDLKAIERLKSMLLDHFVSCFIIGPIFIIPIAISLNLENDSIGKGIMLVIFGIYLCKDSIGGRSVSKRIFGQIVIDIKSGKPATSIQGVIRNFFDLIWVIEVIVVFF